MKRYLLYSFVLVSVGCNSSKEKSKSEGSSLNKHGKLYFDYDEVDYFRIAEDDSKSFDISQPKTRLDTFRLNVLSGRQIPKSVYDTSFIGELEKIDYKKSKIDKPKFEKLNQIFSEKRPKEGLEYSCIPIFRDILIFRKNSKIVGIAKICFECSTSLIVGAKVDALNFGQNEEYEKLYDLLHQ